MRSHAESFFNSRTKYYIGSDGSLIPYEIMVSNRQVFSDGSNELSEFSKEVERRLEYQAANAELFGGVPFSGQGYCPEPKTKADYLDASRRRARRKIFDYCICNDFDCFITLTLDKKQIDRSDYRAVIRKLNNFLGNRVKRRGLKYIGVPELHSTGGLHFHFAATSSAFKLIDSGTVSVPGRKKPVKASTADRLGVPLADRHTVYNIVDWKLGFSTCIKTYGDRGALATYLSKELMKDCQKRLARDGSIDKIGGRWYLHGGDLLKPVCRLENINFDNVKVFSYDVSTDGGNFKVIKLDSNGVLIR